MTSIDWSAHPYTVEDENAGPDGCTVSQAVVVNLRLCEVPRGVKDYDDRKASATIEFIYAAEWVDPRLADWPVSQPLPGELWVPQINIACAGPAFRKTDADGHPVAFVAGAPPGTVTQIRRANMDINCQATADIQRFPLDKHMVTFVLVMADGGGSEYEVFSQDVATSFSDRHGHPVVIPTQEEWRTVAVYWAPAQHVSASTGVSYSDFVVSLERRRMPQYILHKAVYPTTLSAFFGLYSLALPSSDLDARLQVQLALFLTV